MTKGMRAVLRLGCRAAPAEVAGVVGVALLSAVIPVGSAWLTKALLDRLALGAGTGTGTGAWAAVAVPALLLACAGLAAALLPHASTYLQAAFARRSALAAQDALYEKVNRFAGLGRFENPAFLDRLRTAQEAGQQAPSQVMLGVVAVGQTCVTALGFLGSLLAISPAMAWVVLAGAVPAFVGEMRLARARAGAVYRVTAMERREQFYAMLLGDVQAAKELRLFGLGDHFRRLMRADRTAINAVQRRMDLRTLRTHGGLTALAASLAAGGLAWAVWACATGRLTIGDLMMFVAATAAVQASLGGIAFGIAMCHQYLLVFGHYHDVTTATPDLPVLEPRRRLAALHGGIELRDVWFRYSPGHPWVLRGINLTIPFGRSTALVGANGAGKSTLVKLLCRFYDPERGSITWDGTDLRSVPPELLRERLSAVFQDFVAYDLSAAQNIALGDLARAARPEAIAHAARLAGVHDTLEALPRGYDTMLSRIFTMDDVDDGVALSGGQWQRVALARTLLRAERDLVIMDEPSSGLDAEAEYAIHRLLREIREGQTSLLISHRLSAVRAADTIVVLEDGRVVAEGDHDALMREGGLYARMFHLQAQGYEVAR